MYQRSDLMSNIENPEGGLISIAARLLTGKHLERLNEICENKKSISTAKLQAEVDRIEDKLKDEAVYIRNMVRALKQ
jgi:hypothetical protein